MKKILRHLPNFVTSLNGACGILATVYAFKGQLECAFVLMLCAAAFDFLDGFAARALDAYSSLGKELDSLCDVISFGVLPSVMLYKLMCICSFSENIFCYIPLLIAVFSALRLAKFNVDERQGENFLGLPTPACALLCGALCSFVAHHSRCFLATWSAGPVFIPLLSAALCALLVCEIPMFSMKIKFHSASSDHKDNILLCKRIAFGVIILAAGLVALFCHLHWSFVVMVSFLLYILKNIVYRIAGI